MAPRLSGKQRSPRIRLVRGDDVQVVTSESQAVSLEFSGYRREERPESKDAGAKPSTPSTK